MAAAARMLDWSSIPGARTNLMVRWAVEDLAAPLIEEAIMYQFLSPDTFLYYIIARTVFVLLHSLQDRVPLPSGRPRTFMERTIVPLIISAGALVSLSFIPSLGLKSVFLLAVIYHITANSLITIYAATEGEEPRWQKGVLGFGKNRNVPASAGPSVAAKPMQQELPLGAMNAKDIVNSGQMSVEDLAKALTEMNKALWDAGAIKGPDAARGNRPGHWEGLITSNNYNVLVLMDADKKVGYNGVAGVLVYDIDKNGKSSEIYDIKTISALDRTEGKGKGRGTFLMNAYISQLQKAGVEFAIWDAANAEAKTFYGTLNMTNLADSRYPNSYKVKVNLSEIPASADAAEPPMGGSVNLVAVNEAMGRLATAPQGPTSANERRLLGENEIKNWMTERGVDFPTEPLIAGLMGRITVRGGSIEDNMLLQDNIISLFMPAIDAEHNLTGETVIGHLLKEARIDPSRIDEIDIEEDGAAVHTTPLGMGDYRYVAHIVIKEGGERHDFTNSITRNAEKKDRVARTANEYNVLEKLRFTAVANRFQEPLALSEFEFKKVPQAAIAQGFIPGKDIRTLLAERAKGGDKGNDDALKAICRDLGRSLPEVFFETRRGFLKDPHLGNFVADIKAPDRQVCIIDAEAFSEDLPDDEELKSAKQQLSEIESLMRSDSALKEALLKAYLAGFIDSYEKYKGKGSFPRERFAGLFDFIFTKQIGRLTDEILALPPIGGSTVPAAIAEPPAEKLGPMRLPSRINGSDTTAGKDPLRPYYMRILTILTSFAHGTNDATDLNTQAGLIGGYLYLMEGKIPQNMVDDLQRAVAILVNCNNTAAEILDEAKKEAEAAAKKEATESARARVYRKVFGEFIDSRGGAITALYDDMIKAKGILDRQAAEFNSIKGILENDVSGDEKIYLKELSDAIDNTPKIVLDRALCIEGVVADELVDMRDVMATLPENFEKNGLEHFKFIIDQSRPILVKGNRLSLISLVSNLVANGFESADERDRQAAMVTVEVKEDNGRVAIYVTDNGEGIDRVKFGTMGEPFFTKGGTGIGLNECDIVASDHGGFMELESVPGESTTFIVNLPAAAPKVTGVPVNAGPAETPAEKEIRLAQIAFRGINHDSEVFDIMETLGAMVYANFSNQDAMEIMEDGPGKENTLFGTGNQIAMIPKELSATLQDRPLTIDDVRSYVERFDAAVDRLESYRAPLVSVHTKGMEHFEKTVSMLKDVRDFVKGKLTAQVLTVDELKAVVQGAIDAERKRRDRGGSVIVVNLNFDLPDGAKVSVNPLYLKASLFNYIKNAVTYAAETDNLPVNVKVSRQVIEGKDFVRIDVEDSGPGIPAAKLSKVWALNETDREGGTGLGLALVDEFTKMTEGASRGVESKYIDEKHPADHGSIFTLRIPLTPAAPDSGGELIYSKSFEGNVSWTGEVKTMLAGRGYDQKAQDDVGIALLEIMGNALKARGSKEIFGENERRSRNKEPLLTPEEEHAIIEKGYKNTVVTVKCYDHPDSVTIVITNNTGVDAVLRQRITAGIARTDPKHLEISEEPTSGLHAGFALVNTYLGRTGGRLLEPEFEKDSTSMKLWLPKPVLSVDKSGSAGENRNGEVIDMLSELAGYGVNPADANGLTSPSMIDGFLNSLSDSIKNDKSQLGKIREILTNLIAAKRDIVVTVEVFDEGDGKPHSVYVNIGDKVYILEVGDWAKFTTPVVLSGVALPAKAEVVRSEMRVDALTQAQVKTAAAANKMAEEIDGAMADWIIVPEPAKLTLLNPAQTTPVRKRMAEKYKNSETYVEGYAYRADYGDDYTESTFKAGIVNALNKFAAYLKDEKNIDKDPRAIIFAPADRYELVTGILALDEYKDIKKSVTVVKERVPYNGLIHEVVHIDLGKALLNYERREEKGTFTGNQRDALMAYIKTIVPLGVIDGARGEDILKAIVQGRITLEIIAPIDLDKNWRRSQEQYIKLRTSV
ncbi:MAG: ATP-binding protein [Candidatus Omnitrophica bacterium]|nr:ATP-binding protein [Candidatus Omnitrophota bacterium]